MTVASNENHAIDFLLEGRNPIRIECVPGCLSQITKVLRASLHSHIEGGVANLICDSHLRRRKGKSATRRASFSDNANWQTHLFQSLVAEGYIDSTHLQERRSSLFLRRIFLGLSNLLSLIIDDLGGGGDQGHELGELCTKIMDKGMVNAKEEACFGLLWETSCPVNDKPGDCFTRIICPYKISPCTFPRSNGGGAGEDICKSRRKITAYQGADIVYNGEYLIG